MKRTMKTSLEYKRAINVKNLFKELKREGIGTGKVETMSAKLCDTLPKLRKCCEYYCTAAGISHGRLFVTTVTDS